jgi:protein SSD1
MSTDDVDALFDDDEDGASEITEMTAGVSRPTKYSRSPNAEHAAIPNQERSCYRSNAHTVLARTLSAISATDAPEAKLTNRRSTLACSSSGRRWRVHSGCHGNDQGASHFEDRSH